jgi:hypothetical protein
MGLLEYQAMPSLRDVAHDGWLRTFTVKQHWKFHQLAAVRCGNHTCWVTLLQPARRAAVLDQPSSLRPHCSLLPLCFLFVRHIVLNIQGKTREKRGRSLRVFGGGGWGWDVRYGGGLEMSSRGLGVGRGGGWAGEGGGHYGNHVIN